VTVVYCSNSDHNSENLSSAKPESTDEVSGTITIDGREFQLFRVFFGSAGEAAKAGYHPKSYWAKQGRDVVEVGRPALVVAKSWRTYHPAEDEIVLANSLLNEYLVSATKFMADIQSRGCWFVYTEAQTRPAIKGKEPAAKKKRKKVSRKKKVKKRNKESLPTYLPSPSTTSSYDVDNNIKTEPKSRHKQDLRQQQNETRLITRQPKSRTVEVYFPEDFRWDKYPDLEPYRSTVLWLGHKLHERRFLNSECEIHDKDDYIRINSAYARNIAPKFSTVVKLLSEDLDIIERDYYEPGSKSYGYRFADPQLRRATRRRVPLNDPKMAKRINEHRKKEISTRTDRWLHSMLFKLGLADVDQGFLNNIAGVSYRESGGAVEDKLEAYGYWLERIACQEHVWSRDDQGRRYSIVTNLKRELRSLLRVEGQKLQQIDIRNSQWLFLALEMRRDGIDCREYRGLCERGILYETVAETAGSTRPKVKTALTQRALFSANDAPCQKTKIKKTFDKLFPEVAKYLFDAKKHGDGSKLAKTLQAAEAELIIDKICGRLRREGAVKFVTPVHDSLLFLPEDGEYVRSVMLEEFAKLGLRPRLEVKDLES